MGSRHEGKVAVVIGAATGIEQVIKRQQLPEDLVGTVSFLASDDAAFIITIAKEENHETCQDSTHQP